jgi:hypothetical protein
MVVISSAFTDNIRVNGSNNMGNRRIDSNSRGNGNITVATSARASNSRDVSSGRNTSNCKSGALNVVFHTKFD